MSAATQVDPVVYLDEIQKYITFAFEPDHVIELRGLKVKPKWNGKPLTQAGYFECSNTLGIAKAALEITGQAAGVYITMNPVKPDLIARRSNRIEAAEEDGQTKDGDIERRRVLLVDADPTRDAKISASDDEKAAALEVIQAVDLYLRGQGWPEAIFNDSGNGYHLQYRVDLPVDDGGTTEKCLKALAKKFSTSQVKIDTSVYNAARICKLPGTLARKGDSTKKRPHRRAYVIRYPETLQIVPGELLQALAAEAPVDAKAPPGSSGATQGPADGHTGKGEFKSRLMVDRYLSDHGREFRLKPGRDDKGRTVYVLNQCPFDAGHGPDSCVMQAENGALSAQCFHDSCEGRGWQAFKNKIGKPDASHYDPPLKPARRGANRNRSESIYSQTTQGSTSTDGVREAPGPDDAGGAEHSPTDEGGFANYYEIPTDGEPIKVGFGVRVLHDALNGITGNWPKAANSMLFVKRDHDNEPLWMKSASEMLAWIGGRLPSKEGNPLRWGEGPDKVPPSQFHAFVLQNAEQYDAVEPYPHFPSMPKHYYMHAPLHDKPTGAFNELVNKFNPATLVDRDLIVAAALTLFAGIEPGQRPAFLIQSLDGDEKKGRGVGKTTLAVRFSQLVGGYIDIRPTDNWTTVITRLLSPNALTKRTAIVDNIKTLKFSWADLEGAITGRVISGRGLYIGEGRRPNTLTYFLTLNGANLSKDMAQRCVPIVLKRAAEYNPAWDEEISELIESRRWDIISDIINILKDPAPPLKRFSRWSAWEKAVLSRVGDPSECQKVIEERQAGIDEDQTESDIVRDGLHEELVRRGHDPDTQHIKMPSREVAIIVNTIENEPHRAFNRTMTHLYTLNIKEIRKSNRGDSRGCVWSGMNAKPTDTAVVLRPVSWETS